MPYIGPDTIDLLFREPAPEVDPSTFEVLPVVDSHGRPLRTVRTVTKTNCSLTITSVVETRDTGRVIVYSAKAALPVDADTVILMNTDAIRGRGKTFDLTADGDTKNTLRGNPDHVRVYATFEQPIGALDATREQVTITPTFGRDGRGQPIPDGTPIVVMARGVKAGNTTQTFGDDGALLSADFTVAFDLDTAVKDGDRVTVRGRTGYARVSDVLEASADASERIVLVTARTGGRGIASRSSGRR